jgi:hypothetical protein
MDLKAVWQDKGASILTGLGVVGVFSTAVMAAKDTPKALEILKEKEDYKIEHYGHKLTKTEKALALIPLYLPTILMGTATAGCILGANHINKQNQAALIAAYTYLDSSYKEYQHKVKEIFGEEAEKKVREELEKDRYLHETYGSVDDKRLFYDEYSHRYFEMSLFEFQKIMYDVNRIFNHIGELSLNEFYEFLQLDPTELGGKIGWNGHKDWECTGFAWIHANLVEIETPDNLQAFGLVFDIEPNKDFQEW